MATKTENVLARVEPDIKEKAEEIMAQLRVPASVVINMLYKQIIMTKSIPFTLTISSVPMARDEMNTAAFNAVMQKGQEIAQYIASELQTSDAALLRMLSIHPWQDSSISARG